MRLDLATLPALVFGKLKPSEVFTVQPSHVEVVRGSTVTLECAIDQSVTSQFTSDPAEELIQWAKGKLGLGFPPLRRERYSQEVGPSSYSLTITDVQAEDEDDFECQFTSEGIRSKNARLTTIIAPEDLQIMSNTASLTDSLSDDPEMVTVIEGVEAVIDCTSIKAKPSAIPKWESSFSEIEFRGPWEVYDEESRTSNATRQLRFIPKLEHDGMSVQCEAQHPALEEKMVVEKKIRVFYPPKTSINLPAAPVLSGSEIELECALEGANPAVREYRWMIDGEIVENEIENVLKLEVAAAHHQAQISCEAFNGVENAQRPSTGNLDVLFAPILAEKSNRIGVDPSDTEVSLFCDFSSNPAPQINWFLADQHLGSGSTLTLDARANPVAPGSYRCVAENEHGSSAEEILVVVKGPPTITSSNQQASSALECAFLSEPAPSIVEIRNLETNEIIEIGENVEFEKLEIVKVENLPIGIYECKVENDFGSTSARISLYENGLGASTKLGIIVGVLVVAIAMVLFSLVKMKVISNTRRFKLNQLPENDSNGDLESNRRSIVISKPFLQKHQSNPLHVLDSQLDAILDNHVEVRYSDINPSDSGSTHRSAADDGYATESGSNNKIAASIGSNFTNYEFEQSSNPNSGICQTKLKVIWDDSLPQDFETKGLFVANYRKQRSISQV